MKKLVLILSCFWFVGCSTIRLNYESTVETKGSEDQKFYYTQSYDVGGAHQALCIITGIFAGGYCWFYLVMPTRVQKMDLIDDAQAALKKQMAEKEYEESNVTISRENFTEGEVKMSLIPASQARVHRLQ
jgi:hypothetical protein